ncbi:MAG: class I SAM-dependent methyltransferase [Chloracidobacterium sp.]|uniref:Methyltransferase domain-containing protein n=1 Tax=Chloracidobacterium validum TaxID=2821543 RepID=A0ABX8B9P3_9BACT|nr:class I SAM-dependent methyltransferase [Chloracidobacterium validum]QUW03656.1 methyltransferase domain-containing protein [Chloracidobacterium validum]
MGSRQLTSPVVPGAPARCVEALDTSRLIESYQRDYGVDVADYFHGLPQVDIYACSVTGYRFYYPFTLAGREDLYAQLAQFPWYYTDRPEHALAERHIRQSDRVLEIGCGRGFFLKRLAARQVAAVGLDLNRAAVAQCRADGLDVRLETVEAHVNAHAHSYDVVCAFHVLEHITNVHNFLSSTLTLLKPGGCLVIAVPNSDPYAYKFDLYFALNAPPHHMGLWNRQSLKALANVFPMTLRNTYTIPMEIGEYNRYLTFSLVNNSIFFRKRDWLLWNFYQSQQRQNSKQWLTKALAWFMTSLAIPRNLLVVFRFKQ